MSGWGCLIGVGMEKRRLSRRKFLFEGALLVPSLVGFEALAEATWLEVRHHRLGQGTVQHRFVHFTDVHYRGNEKYLTEVVARINGLAPDFALFTGDLIEKAQYARPALEILGGLKVPLYGVPGNHDHWSRADFALFRKAFAATGGAWMQDEDRLLADGRIQLTAVDRLYSQRRPAAAPYRILMVHYPGWTNRIRNLEGPATFDLSLAGHTHGGQVRIPFHGAVVTPYDTDGYELGWYKTPAGPLYVNPGIGTLAVNVRFNCRPELGLFEICGAG